MRIYSIDFDVNRYQSFLPVDDTIYESETLTFDCTSKAKEWPDLQVFVLDTKLIKGNFLYLCPGTLVCDDIAYDAVGDQLEMSGELLPIYFEGSRYHLLNVMECINVLDQKCTEWVLAKDSGKRLRIKKYAFHGNRLTETPIFKIPEEHKVTLFTAEGLIDPEDEFKNRVEASGLTGLMFKESWSDE